MRAPRIQSPERFWKGLGRRTANLKIALEKVYTPNERVNNWIKAGYDEVVARRTRRFNHQYQMICKKAGI